MNTAVIGVGSNIEAEENTSAAKDMLARKLRVVSSSRFVKTEPVGYPEQEDFLNGSLLVETRFELAGLRNMLKEVERNLGRVARENRHGPRKIDLDILVWNGEIVDSDVYEREFLMASVIELCPELERALRARSAGRGGTEVREGMRLRKVLSRSEIEKAVSELAEAISRDYAGKKPVLVCVLNGARTFFDALAERISVPVEKRFLKVKSYGGTVSSGSVELESDIEGALCGRDVLIVEDIVDTAATARFTVGHVESKGPGSVRLCALVDRSAEGEAKTRPHYRGFRVERGFLVGYGMDCMGKGRTLEDIYELEEGHSSDKDGRDGGK